jgi:putative ABC transport system permease protein
VGLGAAVMFVGRRDAVADLFRSVASVLAAPFARLGVPGRLGQANAVRSPRRTSATAAALMVALALVRAVSVLGASLKASVDDVIDTSFGADFVLTSSSFQGFSPSVADALREAPELHSVLAVRRADLQVGDVRTGIGGIQLAAALDVLRLAVVEGDLAALDDGALGVSTELARELSVGVGGSVPVTWAFTGRLELVVGAVYGPNEFRQRSAVAEQVLVDNTDVDLLEAVCVTAADGVSASAARAGDAAVADLPTVTVEDRAFAASQSDQVDQLLNAVTVLFALGIVNTLAPSVVERTRELGLLRAVACSVGSCGG